MHSPDTRKSVILASVRHSVRENMLISSCIAIKKRKKKTTTKKYKGTKNKKFANYQNRLKKHFN